MAVRFALPFAQWVNGSSQIEAGAKLYFYDTGTSTPKSTYSDSDLTVANANPVVADANGKFGDIFMETGQYKVILKTSADVTAWTADPVGDSLEDVTITGSFSLSGAITPSQITANQNNYNPAGLATAVTLRLSTDASRDITGISGGSSGRIIVIRNVGAFNLVLKDESTSSSAANRFALSADVTLSTDQVAVLQYDGTSSRWLVIASPVALTAGNAITLTDTGSGGLTIAVDAASDTADGTVELATTAEVQTGTDTARAVTPGRLIYSPYAAKLWAVWTTNTTSSLLDSRGVSSITDIGTGDTRVNFATAFPDANYCAHACCDAGPAASNNFTYNTFDRTASTVRVTTNNTSGLTDNGYVTLLILGDLA